MNLSITSKSPFFQSGTFTISSILYFNYLDKNIIDSIICGFSTMFLLKGICEYDIKKNSNTKRVKDFVSNKIIGNTIELLGNNNHFTDMQHKIIHPSLTILSSSFVLSNLFLTNLINNREKIIPLILFGSNLIIITHVLQTLNDDEINTYCALFKYIYKNATNIFIKTKKDINSIFENK